MDNSQAKEVIRHIIGEVNKGFLGKTEQVKLAVTAVCAGLHILIEDRPGVGKTTLASALCKALGLDFGRVQFTPDLLPGDITGMTVWDDKKREFLFHEGPIFHQAVMADELNRAAARTQSALLEAMQEGTVTVDGTRHELPHPFMVIATQNPSHFSGTFTLPESQLDRFGVSFTLGYPEVAWESRILTEYRNAAPLDSIGTATTAEELLELRNYIKNLPIQDEVRDYLVNFAYRTRNTHQLTAGLTTRGLQHLLALAQAFAAYEGRDFVIPEDIRLAAPSVARHKLLLTPEMKIEHRTVDFVLDRIFEELPSPV
ncbi:MAG: MoxR family ATPase [Spirochaetales bacterium]|nr:MoxR family ATPase [Spirochaetales bacterium]